MFLRDESVTLRLSTYNDLLDNSRVMEVIDRFEALTGVHFAWSRDMGGPRRRPGSPRPERIVLEEVLGCGMHAAARAKFYVGDPAAEGKGEVTLEVAAGTHPYIGVFRTAIIARVPRERFEDAAFVERYVEWVTWCVEVCEPYMAHAHDADDVSIQNIDSAAMLRRGFGVEVESDPDVGRNPGLEVNRGEFRYMAGWLTVIGPEMREQFGADAVSAVEAFAHYEPTDKHTMWRLYEMPLDAALESSRARQHAMRETLGFTRIANEKAYAYGYWDSKKRKLP